MASNGGKATGQCPPPLGIERLKNADFLTPMFSSSPIPTFTNLNKQNNKDIVKLKEKKNCCCFASIF